MDFARPADVNSIQGKLKNESIVTNTLGQVVVNCRACAAEYRTLVGIRIDAAFDPEEDREPREFQRQAPCLGA